MSTGNRGDGNKHLVVMLVVAAVLSAVLAYIFLRFDFLPNSFSRERTYIDTLFRVMLAIASVIFVLIMTFFVDSLVFYRQRRGERGYGAPITGNTRLEWTWTLIPLAIVMGLSAWGAIVLSDMGQPVVDPATQTDLQVDVLAFRFGWQFTYPQYDNVTSYELEMPVNRRVHFLIRSKDVIHSFWVQDLGPKQDAVPGMTTELYITPTKTGDYTVQCSQLCGIGHTFMTAPAYVVSASEFNKWVKQQEPAPTSIPTPTPSPTPSPTTSPGQAQAVTINLIARNIAFNVSTITVPAGAKVTVNFDNEDTSVSHNFSVYTNSSATTPLFVGKIITGPAKITYTFTAPTEPGTYFFRCDVHPTIMTGTFVVK